MGNDPDKPSVPDHRHVFPDAVPGPYVKSDRVAEQRQIFSDDPSGNQRIRRRLMQSEKTAKTDVVTLEIDSQKKAALDYLKTWNLFGRGQ